MSLEKALGYLEKAGYREHVIQLGESTATVAMAAEALGVEPGRIAKTMSFLQGDKAVLIITEGTAKIDNRKYKDTFHVKAKMIPFEEVENNDFSLISLYVLSSLLNIFHLLAHINPALSP